MRAWWKRLQPRQRWGGALAATGAGLTVLLAFLSNQTQPPAAVDEVQAARQRIKANSDALATVDLPMPVEPAFQFKA